MLSLAKIFSINFKQVYIGIVLPDKIDYIYFVQIFFFDNRFVCSSTECVRYADIHSKPDSWTKIQVSQAQVIN